MLSTSNTRLEDIDNELIRSVAVDYSNVDAGFAYGTWALETGYGTSSLWLESNNPAGIIKLDGSGDYQTYATPEDGMRAMFDLLEVYCENGNDTVAKVRERWSESEDTSKIIEIWKSILEEKEND